MTDATAVLTTVTGGDAASRMQDQVLERLFGAYVTNAG